MLFFCYGEVSNKTKSSSNIVIEKNQDIITKFCSRENQDQKIVTVTNKKYIYTVDF